MVDDPRVDVNLMSSFYSNKDADTTCNRAPLHLAINKSNEKIVEILLSSPKIDVNIKTTTELCQAHQTPLHLAVLKKNIEIINLLLKHKEIDLNAVDKDGKKAIDYADDDEIKQLINKK